LGLLDIEPVHVAAWVESLDRDFAPPSVKQWLAAVRMLFDWLGICQVLGVNPAAAVSGPKYVVRTGKTPITSIDNALRGLKQEILESLRLAPENSPRDGFPALRLAGFYTAISLRLLSSLNCHSRRTSAKTINAIPLKSPSRLDRLDAALGVNGANRSTHLRMINT
jgi:hypothetical protein